MGKSKPRNYKLVEDDAWKKKGGSHRTKLPFPKICPECKGKCYLDAVYECPRCEGEGIVYETPDA